MGIIFTKLESAGNDFVLIEEGATTRGYSELARYVCNRNFGIGADGLLILINSDRDNIGMRVFNPDGSEAEACGNGLRCLVKYALDNRILTSKTDVINVHTKAGQRSARIIRQSSEGTSIETTMGAPEFKPGLIPVNIDKEGCTNILDIKFITDYPLEIKEAKLLLSFVSMGNPHAIHFTHEPVEGFPLEKIGPEVENHPLFPNKTNFEIARVLTRDSIEARVWERGAGETLACGSGACGIGVIGQLKGLVNNPVTINLPGGSLNVEWKYPGEVLLQGTARTVFTGELYNNK